MRDLQAVDSVGTDLSLHSRHGGEPEVLGLSSHARRHRPLQHPVSLTSHGVACQHHRLLQAVRPEGGPADLAEINDSHHLRVPALQRRVYTYQSMRSHAARWHPSSVLHPMEPRHAS